METYERDIVTLINSYTELQDRVIHARDTLLSLLVNWYGNGTLSPEAQEDIDDSRDGEKPPIITDLRNDDHNIYFNFVGYDILIRFILHATKENGHVKWYYRKPGKEDILQLVFSHKFNRNGNLIGKEFSDGSMYMGANLKKYLKGFLPRFVENVDSQSFLTDE